MACIIGSRKSAKEPNEPILQTRISRRDFLKYTGPSAAAAYLASLTGCKDNIITQPNYVKIIASGRATETLSGSPLSGIVRFIGPAYELDTNNKPYSKNFDVTVPFGTQASLGMMPEGQSASYEMDFTANDALKRIFKAVAMQGTNDFQTDLLNLNGFNYPGMRQYMTGYGTVPEYVTNKRWNVDKVDVTFNPDHLTGEKLPKDFIDPVKAVVLKMVSNSGGFIKSYSFNDANKLRTEDPPDTEIRVFYASDIQGMATGEYPRNGDQIKSAKILINPEKTTPETLYWDVYNLFLQGVNDIVVTPNATNNVDTWYKFLFKRPIDVKFYNDREELNGFSGTANYLGKTRVTLTEDFSNRLPSNPLTDVLGNKETKYNKREFTETPEKRIKEKRTF